jgi:GT2 family glycosyltransferase
MPEYINHNPFEVHLSGPDGLTIKMKPYSKKILSDYYHGYVNRGFIRLVKPRIVTKKNNDKTEQVKHIEQQVKQTKHIEQKRVNKSLNAVQQPRQRLIPRSKRVPQPKKTAVDKNSTGINKNKLVGIRSNANADELLKLSLRDGYYPISNNIGIGILSHQRPNALKRLISSIKKHTDFRKTSIFISDDGSTDSELNTYLDQLANSGDFTIIRNDRIGVAGNSNRLLRCLSRFKYGILLNDDVEILKNGWEYFYVRAFEKTGMHHFVFRQPGVYGARKGTAVSVRDTPLNVIHERPHGAVLAFTRNMLTSCGYFNEDFGLYGMEHVDWSSKAWEFKLQDKGFFDVEDSHKYFMIHNEPSSIHGKDELFRKSKDIFAKRIVCSKTKPTDASKVDEITYVIPIRDHGRTDSIRTVINNIRAQRFPVVNIIVVEQDIKHKINVGDYEPITYLSALRKDSHLFNKSYAFNIGARACPSDKLILHDADMMTHGDYARKIWNILENADSCHIGNRVIYTDQQSCDCINRDCVVADTTTCERVVGYFEGGSLACTRAAFWKCGAFNEDFWGYGCEDCDFYVRLSSGSNWYGNRDYDLLHLWHPRTSGWNDHHDANKQLESELKKLSIDQRINDQLLQLRSNGYGSTLRDFDL